MGLATTHHHLGEFYKAQIVFVNCLRLLEMMLGKDHLKYLVVMNILGSSFLATREYEKAQQFFEKCYEQTRRVLGEKHPEFFNALNNLAIYYEKMGNYKKAKVLYQKFLQIGIQEEKEQDPTPEYLDFLNNLANAHRSVGDLNKCLEVQKKSCLLTERLRGEVHHDYLVSLSNLATTF